MQRGVNCNEENLSAIETETSGQARISFADADEGRPRDNSQAAFKRSVKAHPSLMGAQSFSKRRSLRGKKEFGETLRRGCVWQGGPLKIYCARNRDSEEARLGILASKRFVKLATARNRLRRVVKEAFRRRPELDGAGYDIVVRVVGDCNRFTNNEIRELLGKFYKDFGANRRESRNRSGKDV